MMKFFLSFAGLANDRPAWETDPLRHPALADMDQRELGDLPMVPALRERPVQGVAACRMASGLLPLLPAGEKVAHSAG